MMLDFSVVFFKQKTAYEMRISDWSSDVCSSDLKVGDGVCRGRVAGIDDRAGAVVVGLAVVDVAIQRMPGRELALAHANHQDLRGDLRLRGALRRRDQCVAKPEQAAHVPVVLMVGQVGVAAAVICLAAVVGEGYGLLAAPRSEEHTSELQSLMRISYAVFCLKK